MTTAIRILHLTNGSAIIPKMREAGVEGAIVPWNDVLHEGPVLSGLRPAALLDVRAGFLASCGWGSHDEIVRELRERDEELDAALGGANRLDRGHGNQDATPHRSRVDEIVLWFEHDLYDQLQLIQILDRLPVDGSVRLTAVTAATYLGELPASDYVALLENRRVLTPAEQLAARDAWQAFRSSDPRDIVSALPRITVLPHLAPALGRHLEQFPSVENGLSRTEQQTLEVLRDGRRTLREVFMSTQQREEAFFMGDAGFLFHISSLFAGTRPLVRTVASTLAPSTLAPGTLAPGTLALSTLAPGTLAPSTLAPEQPGSLELSIELTSNGERVMKGELDRVVYCGIDRWLGGVHLSSNTDTPIWRWDQARQTLRVLEGG